MCLSFRPLANQTLSVTSSRRLVARHRMRVHCRRTWSCQAAPVVLAAAPTCIQVESHRLLCGETRHKQRGLDRCRRSVPECNPSRSTAARRTPAHAPTPSLVLFFACSTRFPTLAASSTLWSPPSTTTLLPPLHLPPSITLLSRRYPTQAVTRQLACQPSPLNLYRIASALHTNDRNTRACQQLPRFCLPAGARPPCPFHFLPGADPFRISRLAPRQCRVPEITTDTSTAYTHAYCTQPRAPLQQGDPSRSLSSRVIKTGRRPTRAGHQ